MLKVVQTPIFRSWLTDLRDDQTRKRIVAGIRKMTFGNFGDVRPVGEGVSETRLHFGPGYRLYFTQEGQNLVILLCGGTKRRQQQDIELAKAIKKELK